MIQSFELFISFQVRLYTVAVPDYEISEHIAFDSLERTVLKSYGNLHFRMEDSTGATTLTNSGLLSATAKLNGGSFVKVNIFNNQLRLQFQCPRGVIASIKYSSLSSYSLKMR